MRLRINQREVNVAGGSSLLQAAQALGIAIPTMCHHESCSPTGSCLVCLVQDTTTGRLVPACVAPAAEGMTIETDNPAVQQARKAALELLLSEHAGDCHAPCDRGCPARVDVPRLIRHIQAGDAAAALQLVRRSLALPRAIAHLCYAPCERVCRRARHDAGVAIRSLEGFAIDAGTATAGRPPLPPPRGVCVAVVGAGPAGLSAAYHLRLAGYDACLFDSADAPGGTLRAVPAAQLPPADLAADLELIRELGISFRMHTRVALGDALLALRREYPAVVLAVGARASDTLAPLGLRRSPADTHTFGTVVTDGSGLFACGSAVRPRQHLVQALADGQAAAQAVDVFLTPRPGPAHHRFDSHLGALHDGEMAEFLKEADPSARVAAASGRYAPPEATREAARCMHCDCRKQEGCKLRDYSDAFGASQDAYRSPDRLSFERNLQHPDIVYEGGKCIRCGLCIQVAANAGDTPGLTFIGRGYDVRLRVPFEDALSDALRISAAACVAVCPTAALASRNAP